MTPEASEICEAAATPTEILSNADQIRQECLAADVFATPAMQRALERLEMVASAYPQFHRAAGAATWRRSLEELSFAYVNKTLNLEAGRSCVLWDQNAPLRRGDRLIPGSRSYGNNPDNIYRRVPVDPAGRYRLRGRRRDPGPGDANFSVLPSYLIEHGWKPVTLDIAKLDTDADGWFEVTLDATDGGGAPNHMRLAPNAERLTVRDSMRDWSREFPTQIEILRLDREERDKTIDPDEVGARLAPHLDDYLHHHVKLTDRIIYGGEPNRLIPPAMSPSGGLLTQALSNGWFDLRDGEALLVEADMMDACYLSLQVWDPWMFALNYRDRTGSLNDFQARPDADGRYRFVVSSDDPGVHNWIDTDGLAEGGMALRWQGLRSGIKSGGASVTSRIVPVSKLHKTLPGSTHWIGARERENINRLRRDTHDRRFML